MMDIGPAGSYAASIGKESIDAGTFVVAKGQDIKSMLDEDLDLDSFWDVRPAGAYASERLGVQVRLLSHDTE